MSVSSCLTDPSYKEMINNFLIEKKPNPFKQQKIYEQIKSCKNIKFIENGNTEFKDKVLSQLNNLCALKPGRRLLKFILKANYELQIVFTKNECASFNLKKEGYSVIQYDEERRVIKSGINSDKEKVFFLTPQEINLAHELCHVAFRISGKEYYKKTQNSPPTLSPLFDNLQEQITITGIDENGHFHPICENTLLVALGKNFLRIDHRGPKESTLYTVIQYGCLGTLKKEINLDPNLINRKINFTDKSGYLNLLTLTVVLNQKELFTYLVGAGANINQSDTKGGILIAAIKSDRLHFIEDILLLPNLDYNMQDSKGNIAAYYANYSLLEASLNEYVRYYEIFEKIASKSNLDITNEEGLSARELIK